jgi:HTH-type transcriptional regulator, transcriptional repressor of NAD biosynthesis genes
MTSGFLLGKFLPLHRGHMYLIDTARQQVDELTVLVCTLKREPIPGQLRYEWVKSLYPDVNVIHYAEDIPQTPDEHPDFWVIWHDLIRQYVPVGPDFVFSSEHYGDKLAEVLGARHICADLPRLKYPVSGTAVRENPKAMWGLIPPVVQDYYKGLGIRPD